MERSVLFLPQRTAFCLSQAVYDAADALCVTLLPPDADEQTRLAAIAEAEVLVGEPTLDALTAAKKLRWLQLTWAGAERYTGGGFPKDVLLTTASGAFGETIAEHAMAMLLALCRRLPAYLRRNEWRDLGCEKSLSGATALVFGTGDVGTQIARRLKAFSARVIGVCRNTKLPRPYFDALATLDTAEAFLPEADFVIGALPHATQTAGYLSKQRLTLLKEDAVLVNVGRGSFLDTAALCECLRQKKLFGVGLDVFEEEPLPESHPLRGFENVVLTPHVAGIGFGHLPQTEQRIWQLVAENLRRYQDGAPLLNRVVFP